MRRGRRGTGAVLRSLLAGALLTAIPAAGWAQTAIKTQVRLAPRVLVEVDVETPLIINVGPAESLPSNSYIQVRGLPESAALNEGHSISPGTWAVPLRSLANLTIQAPMAAAGTTEFTVRVVSLEGSVLAEVKSSIIVVAGYVIGQRSAALDAQPKMVQPPMPAAPAPVAAPPRAPQAAVAAPIVQTPPAPAPAPPASGPKLSAEDKVRLEKMVGLGNRHMSSGNIAAAREFFRRAAEGGLADGAMLLAATYDPDELSALNVQGLSPDPAEARRWYERARSLGAAGVEARLARLGAR